MSETTKITLTLMALLAAAAAALWWAWRNEKKTKAKPMPEGTREWREYQFSEGGPVFRMEWWEFAAFRAVAEHSEWNETHLAVNYPQWVKKPEPIDLTAPTTWDTFKEAYGTSDLVLREEAKPASPPTEADLQRANEVGIRAHAPVFEMIRKYKFKNGPMFHVSDFRDIYFRKVAAELEHDGEKIAGRFPELVHRPMDVRSSGVIADERAAAEWPAYPKVECPHCGEKVVLDGLRRMLQHTDASKQRVCIGSEEEYYVPPAPAQEEPAG